MPNKAQHFKTSGYTIAQWVGPRIDFHTQVKKGLPTACTKLDLLVKIATQNHTWTSSSNLDFEQLGLGNSKFWLTRTKPAQVQPNSAPDIRALKCKQKES